MGDSNIARIPNSNMMTSNQIVFRELRHLTAILLRLGEPRVNPGGQCSL